MSPIVALEEGALVARGAFEDALEVWLSWRDLYQVEINLVSLISRLSFENWSLWNTISRAESPGLRIR